MTVYGVYGTWDNLDDIESILSTVFNQMENWNIDLEN